MSVEIWCEIADSIATFAEGIMSVVFVNTFMGGKLDKRQYKTIVTAIAIQFFFISVYDAVAVFSVGKIALSQIILVVALFCIYKRDYDRIILLKILDILGYMLIESISVCIAVYVSNNSFEAVTDNSGFRLSLIVIGTMTKIFYVAMIRIFLRNTKTLRRRSALIMLLFSAGILVFATYMFDKCVEMNSISTSEVAVFIVLAIMELLVIFSVAMMDDNYNKTEEISLAVLHRQMLMSSLDEEKHNFEMWRTRVHDYKNHMIYMREMLERKEYEKMRMMLDDEIGILRKQSSYVDTGYTGIDAIVNMKIPYAQSKGIHVIYDIKLPDGLKLNNTAIASILGNLMDNAIRASLQTEEKYVELRISCVLEKLRITVINTTAEKNVNFNKSSKNDKWMHGIGLNSVKKNAREINGICEIKQIDDKVQVMVTIDSSVK